MNTKLNHEQDWLQLAKQANWSVIKLAKHCDVSVRTLERQFVKSAGKTPKTWLTEQRQYQAVKAVQSGLSIKEVAYQLHYKHATQFSREFRKFWGFCPGKPFPLEFLAKDKCRDLFRNVEI